IHKCMNKSDILDFVSNNAYKEVDVILKICGYIVEELNDDLKVYVKWGESFYPLSKSTNYTNGRKCDVQFLSMSGVNVGEWEFSAKITATRIISDRCYSARINQSILNGLLEYNLSDEQAENICVPFLQFDGTSGQLLIENLVEGFYIVFPGPKFELPTKLRDIRKLKTSVCIIKSAMDMYKKTCEIIENLETTHHEFEDIFSEDEINTTKPMHYKYKYA
ncbi:7731_t:CDS:2, partial [Racocetra persica]